MTHVGRQRVVLLSVAAAAAVALAVLVVLGSTSAGAASSVRVTLRDFDVTAAPGSAAHGRVTFTVRNAAGMEHELVVIRTSRRAGDLPLRGGRAVETGRKGRTVVGAGARRSLTLRLARGHYALICNIGGHYRAGMHTDFTVR